MATRGIEPLGPSLRAMGEIAAAADEAGLAAAWTAEIYRRSATVALGEMARSTTRCTVGSAIAYGVGRSPLTLATEARDLDELSDGRLILGLGNGTRRMLSDWFGADPDAPATRMEELVPLLRRIWRLHEEPVNHDGRFYRLHIAPPEVPPPLRERIPIYTAGANPRMIEVAGRVADGLLAHPLCTVRYLEDVALPAVERGAAHAGRDLSEIQLASLVIAAVDDDDPDQARRDAAAMIAFYSSVKTYDGMLDAAGFGSEAAACREAFRRGDLAAMVGAVSEPMVDAFAAAGTTADVRAALARFDAVLDHVIMFPPSFQVTPERVQENALALIARCA